MATDSEPRTSADVIARVQLDWAQLQRVVGGLSEAQLTAPGREGWSVKDHLAHIADWERALTSVLSGRPQSEGFGLDEADYRQLDGDIDKLNDRLYQRSRLLSLVELRASVSQAHAGLLAALGRLTDADVQNTIAGFGGDPSDHRPLLGKIAGDSYGHYADHAGWIQTLLNG